MVNFILASFFLISFFLAPVHITLQNILVNLTLFKSFKSQQYFFRFKYLSRTLLILFFIKYLVLE